MSSTGDDPQAVRADGGKGLIVQSVRNHDAIGQHR